MLDSGTKQFDRQDSYCHVHTPAVGSSSLPTRFCSVTQQQDVTQCTIKGPLCWYLEFLQTLGALFNEAGASLSYALQDYLQTNPLETPEPMCQEACIRMLRAAPY